MYSSTGEPASGNAGAVESTKVLQNVSENDIQVENTRKSHSPYADELRSKAKGVGLMGKVMDHSSQMPVSTMTPVRVALRAFLGGALLLAGLHAQEPTVPLEALSVRGTTLPQATVLKLTELQIGASIGMPDIEAACARLQSTGMFATVAYRFAPGRTGWVLGLSVTEPRKFTDATIDFAGVDQEGVWRWLVSRYPLLNRRIPALAGAEQFVAAQIQQHLGAQIEGQKVVTRTEWDADTEHVSISLQPEKLPRISSLVFSGELELTSGQLSAILEKHLADFGYTDRAFRKLVELNLRPAYEEHGMYRVRFPSIKSKRVTASTVAVTAEIEEGAKYTLRDVRLVGDHLPSAAMLKAAQFCVGQTAVWSAIEQSIRDMEVPLKRTGYLDAAAKPERVFDDQQHFLDLKISFDLGPLYHFGSLRIAGLPPALEKQARKLWKMQPGDPFDYGYPNDFVKAFVQGVDANDLMSFDYESLQQERHGEAVVGITLLFKPTEARMSGTAEPYSVTAKVLDDHARTNKWPVYPAEAKVQKITGTVRMRLRVDRSGNVTDVSVLDGPPALTAVAAASVRQRAYQPFLRDGSAVAVTGDAYLTFTLNPDAQMPVFPGDEIDALLDAATMTVLDLKVEATEKYCFEAIQRARLSNEDHSYTIQDALRILYALYSRAAKADSSKSENLHKRLTAIMAEQEQPNAYWTAQAVFGLGGEYLSQKRFQDAGEQYARVISLLGPCEEPPGTNYCSMLLGDALGYQAVVLYAQGKIGESLPFFEKAVVRPDGAIHEETEVVAMSIYSNALAQVGRVAEAAEAAKRLQEYQQAHPNAAKKAGIAR
jgi:TonB family protein